jgi:hypothetical protein
VRYQVSGIRCEVVLPFPPPNLKPET